MFKSALTVAASMLMVSLVSLPAQAEPETHDGFFLRLQPNLGWASLTESYDVPGAAPDDLTVSGLTMGVDLYLGGTLAPGFVLGGALLYSNTPSPTAEQGPLEIELDGNMYMIGAAAFGQYYLDPHEGLHFQGLLGYGALTYVQNGNSGNSPSGLMFGLGAGYDIWLGDQWSVGPFGRFVYGAFSYENNGAESSDSFIYPSIGAAFTYH